MMGQDLYSVDLADKHWWWRARGHVLHKLTKKHIPRLKRVSRILDIGCGTGVSLPILGEFGVAVRLADGRVRCRARRGHLPCSRESLPIGICI